MEVLIVSAREMTKKDEAKNKSKIVDLQQLEGETVDHFIRNSHVSIKDAEDI